MHPPAVQWVEEVKQPEPEADRSLWVRLLGNQVSVCGIGSRFSVVSKVVRLAVEPTLKSVPRKLAIC
jgi:ABC-type enterochelin transport system substrate-binding protein